MAARIGAPAWIRLRLTSSPSSSKNPPSFAAQMGPKVAVVEVKADLRVIFCAGAASGLAAEVGAGSPAAGFAVVGMAWGAVAPDGVAEAEGVAGAQAASPRARATATAAKQRARLTGG